MVFPISASIYKDYQVIATCWPTAYLVKQRRHGKRAAVDVSPVIGPVISPLISQSSGQAFDQLDRKQAGETWHRVAGQLRSRWPKLAELMDTSEHDVLAYMAFPRQHRTKLHNTSRLIMTSGHLTNYTTLTDVTGQRGFQPVQADCYTVLV